jgi:hypothetical protein
MLLAHTLQCSLERLDALLYYCEDEGGEITLILGEDLGNVRCHLDFAILI